MTAQDSMLMRKDAEEKVQAAAEALYALALLENVVEAEDTMTNAIEDFLRRKGVK